MPRYFITAKEDVSVDKLLKSNLPADIEPETVIESGGVWKNSRERIMKKETVVLKGATVRVYTSPGQGKEYRLSPSDLIFENQDLLVVYKPPGINVHEVPATRFYNLNHGVNKYLEESGISYKSVPVTRLDRVVEGLVIFPKNKRSEKALFRLIMDRQINKWYTACTESDKGDRYRIVNKISSDGSRTRVDSKGKIADTLFIKTGTCVYSVFIFTGRRHQIRCHAADSVSPLKGDTLYGGESMKGRGIGLICRGYNIPWKGRNLRVRLSSKMLEDFFNRVCLPAS